MSQQSVQTNSDLARLIAEVADALAECNHLPAVANASVGVDGTVRLNPSWTQRGEVVLATWAAALGVPVVIDMSTSGYLRTVVPLGAFEAKIEIYIMQRRAYELGAALQIPVSPGGQVEVVAEQLLAVLDGEAADAPAVQP